MFAQVDKVSVMTAACGRWRELLEAEGAVLPPRPFQHGPCPYCGGKDRFRFDDKDGEGTWICNQCGAGTGMTLFMRLTGWNFPKALSELAYRLQVPMYGNTNNSRARTPGSQPSNPEPSVNRCAWRQFRKLQETARSIVGTPVEKYLANRGLAGLRLNDSGPELLFQPELEYWQGCNLIGRYPAMLAPVRNLAGELVTFHRTYLSDAGRKAPVANPKKLLTNPRRGASRGCAIRLYPPDKDGRLALAEGVETALGVTLATGLPCWATINAGGLERVQLPQFVREVYIMADKDRSGTGQQAAQNAAAHFVEEGRQVRICLPKHPIPDGAKSIDWLDVYNRA